MIEMHQDGDDSIGDERSDVGAYRTPGPGIAAMVFSAPALGIASLITGFAALTTMRSADVVGEALLFSSKVINSGELTNVRGQAVVQLIAAGIALLLGLAAALRVSGPTMTFTTDDDADDEEDEGDPLWVRAIIGAALLVAVLAVVAAGGSLIEATHVHLAKEFGGS